jgi:uncharacterized protein involved in cysteine biosynthesis
VADETASPEALVYVATPRPGLLRRLGAGAWHVFSGFWFLVRHPDLWPLAALPALLALLGIVGGLMLGAYSLRFLETAVLPAPGRLPALLSLFLLLALWVGTLGSGALLGLGLALLLSAPVLDRLSRRVEEKVRVVLPDGRGWKWEMAQSVRATLYFLVSVPLVLLLSLIPLVGSAIGLLWAAHALSVQETDMALARRGLDFRGRLRWHRRYLAESLGFGAAGLIFLLPASFVLGPVLVVGATLMVLEIDEDLVPPDRPARRTGPGPLSPRP